MPIERMPAPEPSAAEKEATMEQFRSERATLLAKVFNRKTIESAALLMPGTDVAGLVAFAARGETLAGKTLDGRERVNYAVTAGFLGLSYMLQLSGAPKEALAARGVAASIGAMEFGPELIERTVSVAAKRFPAIASFVGKTGDFLQDKIGMVKDFQRSVTEDLAVTGPEPLSFDVDG